MHLPPLPPGRPLMWQKIPVKQYKDVEKENWSQDRSRWGNWLGRMEKPELSTHSGWPQRSKFVPKKYGKHRIWASSKQKGWLGILQRAKSSSGGWMSAPPILRHQATCPHSHQSFQMFHWKHLQLERDRDKHNLWSQKGDTISSVHCTTHSDTVWDGHIT